MMNPTIDIRQFARLGALEVCRRAVAEFPDILAELNKLAKPAAVAPDAPTPSTRRWTAAQRSAQSARMRKLHRRRKAAR